MTTTTEFVIRPSDGWVQVSTGPTQFLKIDPQFKCNWSLHIGATAPTDASAGVSYAYGRGENCFMSDATITDDAYVRVRDTPETLEACRFTVIAEASSP